MTLEIGSNQFRVHKIDIKNNTEGTLIYKVTEGEEDVMGKIYKIQNKGSIGRKPTCEISLDDVHLSNLHAKFSMENGKFIFEDMCSTNGSWMRLSEEGSKSPPH